MLKFAKKCKFYPFSYKITPQGGETLLKCVVNALIMPKTYYEVLLDWVNNKNDVKIQTKQKYEDLIENYLKNEFENSKSCFLKKEDFINFFKVLEEKNVSSSIRKTLLYIIKASILVGHNKGETPLLDLSEIKFKPEKKEIEILSKLEQTKLESHILSKLNIRKLCILLTLYTGLRIGEVCGLKWKDIDFENHCLYVRRTIQRVKCNDGNKKSKLIESTPKSKSSIRKVPIPAFIIELLKDYYTNDEDFILSRSTKLYDPRLLESSFSRLIKKVGIKKIKYHALRHTFATRSIEAGVDIKTLSELLGHSSVDITLKTYVHTSDELKKKSIDKLVSYMQEEALV